MNKAALQGDAEAQFSLCLMYFKGDCVKKDDYKAKKLIDKADSTHDLGKAYQQALKEIEKTEIDEGEVTKKINTMLKELQK